MSYSLYLPQLCVQHRPAFDQREVVEQHWALSVLENDCQMNNVTHSTRLNTKNIRKVAKILKGPVALRSIAFRHREKMTNYLMRSVFSSGFRV